MTPESTRMPQNVTLRSASVADREAIHALGHRTLGWLDDAQEAEFFAWKHEANPFGMSPIWVAEADARIVGLRAFMRWELSTPRGDVRRVVRAVDTTTDPAYQGRGIFSALTLHALDALRAEGVDFVFNTPNNQSRPGYLKMGWSEVGQLPLSVRATRAGSPIALARARVPASRSAVVVRVGDAAPSVFADAQDVARALESSPLQPGLATRRTPDYFAWRYGLPQLHYRVFTAPEGVGNGFAVFHVRRRGPALEAVVCDVVVPDRAAEVEHALLSRIARESGADYLIRLGGPLYRHGFVRVPAQGPVLTARALSTDPPADVHDWALGMGEIELF